MLSEWCQHRGKEFRTPFVKHSCACGVVASAATAHRELLTTFLDAARSNGFTTSGDESQLASLFSVRQPGNPGFNIVEP